MDAILPVLLFVVLAALLSVAMIGVSLLVGPKRNSPVKQMPYESGMDPIHDTKKKFDVRFHLVAIAFLVFDVELLFLYPWAVAAGPEKDTSKPARGIDAAVQAGLVSNRGLIFAEVLVFIALLAIGFIYAWRKGVFRWR